MKPKPWKLCDQARAALLFPATKRMRSKYTSGRGRSRKSVCILLGSCLNLGKVNRHTIFSIWQLLLYRRRTRSSKMYAFSWNGKPYKNAINRAINIYFIRISLKLPDNNHVKMGKYYLFVRTHVFLTSHRKPDVLWTRLQNGNLVDQYKIKLRNAVCWPQSYIINHLHINC